MSLFNTLGCCQEDAVKPGINADFWLHWVFCTKIDIVAHKAEETDYVRFFRLREANVDECESLRVTCLVLTTPPDQAVAKILDKRIKAFSEWRQFWTILGLGVPKDWPTYHSYMILEIEGEERVRILLEKKSNRLEITFGCGELSHGFMEQFRATLVPRNPIQCSEHAREDLDEFVTVRQLLAWIDGPLARRWQAYSLLQSNCQHFAEDLQEYLRNPHKARDIDLEKQSIREGVLHAVTTSPHVLQQTSEVLRNDRSFILQIVAKNGEALQFVPQNFQWDWSVALAAVRQNGTALQYVPLELRHDCELCIAAVRQSRRALQYVPDPVHDDEAFRIFLKHHS